MQKHIDKDTMHVITTIKSSHCDFFSLLSCLYFLNFSVFVSFLNKVIVHARKRTLTKTASYNTNNNRVS